jgi:hypothetical protein
MEDVQDYYFHPFWLANISKACIVLEKGFAIFWEPIATLRCIRLGR